MDFGDLEVREYICMLRIIIWVRTYCSIDIIRITPILSWHIYCMLRLIYSFTGECIHLPGPVNLVPSKIMVKSILKFDTVSGRMSMTD